MDKWKAVRVFVDNAPDQWHVSTGKWGEQSIAVAKDEATAKFLATLPDLLGALKDALESLKRLSDAEGAFRITCILQAEAVLSKVEGH